MMADSNMDYSTSQYIDDGNQLCDQFVDGPNTNELPLSIQKQRILYSNEQKKILEEEFAKNSCMKRLNYFSLSNKLRLSEKQVKIWFQNRRAKEKRTKIKKLLKPSEATDYILQSSKYQRPEELKQQPSYEHKIDVYQGQDQYQCQCHHQWLNKHQCQYHNQNQNQQSRQNQHLWQIQHLHQDHYQQQNPHQYQNQYPLQYNQGQQIQQNQSRFEEKFNEYHQRLPEYSNEQLQQQHHHQVQQYPPFYEKTVDEYQSESLEYPNKQQYQYQYQVQQQVQQYQLWYEETTSKYQEEWPEYLNEQQQHQHQYQILQQTQQLNHHMDWNVTCIDSPCELRRDVCND